MLPPQIEFALRKMRCGFARTGAFSAAVGDAKVAENRDGLGAGGLEAFEIFADGVAAGDGLEEDLAEAIDLRQEILAAADMVRDPG